MIFGFGFLLIFLLTHLTFVTNDEFEEDLPSKCRYVIRYKLKINDTVKCISQYIHKYYGVNEVLNNIIVFNGSSINKCIHIQLQNNNSTELSSSCDNGPYFNSTYSSLFSQKLIFDYSNFENSDIKTVVRKHGLEINSKNCINNSIITTECSFRIRISPPLNSKLKCTLKFNDLSNTNARFSNVNINIKTQLNNNCPSFELGLNILNKSEKISTSCGGIIEPLIKEFKNFTSATFVYDNHELIDSETNIVMDINLCNPIEINSKNCINKNIIQSKCSFNIRIIPPLNNKLECILQFIDSNNSIIQISNEMLKLKSQDNISCPFFNMDLNTDIKSNKIALNCGGSVDKFSIFLHNFKNATLIYENQGFNDLETNIIVDIYLLNINSCELENNSKSISLFIIILIIVLVIMAIFLLIGFYEFRTRQRKQERNKLNRDTSALYVGIQDEDKDVKKVDV